jgi:EpsD family peptidyl-prolyl cis-trans isomerase
MILGGVALLAVSTGACKREATGQVAAVVNDDEVTLQEVNGELAGVTLPAGAERKAAQQAALQRVIDRRLLAQAARQENLDKDPEFITRRRQQEELLLVQMFGQKLSRSVRVPDAKAVDKFIASHPNMFAARSIFTVERLQFVMDPAKLEQFTPDHSLDAVASRLTSLGVKFARGAGELDSAKLTPEMSARLAAVPAGEPFIVPETGAITAAVVTGTKPAPISGDAARPLAARALQNEQLKETLQDRLKAEKAKAKIEYQAEFAPAPKPVQKK